MRRLSALGATGLAGLLLLGLAACGPSMEEIDATTTAKIATAVAGVPLPAAQPTATPIAFPTPFPPPTPIAMPTPLPTPTPVTFPTPLPTATPVTFPTPLPTPTPITFPTPLPTATPITLPPTPTPQAPPSSGVEDFSAVYQEVVGSVVYVETPDSLGSGWVMRDGLIATNEHVISGEDQVTVRHAFLPPFRATVVFSDPVVDVAFLSFSATTSIGPLPTRIVSSENLGEPLLVLGYSRVGVQENGSVGGAAVKRGVLSQIVNFGSDGGRRLRIDAAVDPGDSGGPVFDAEGRVVGMSKGVVETTETGQRIVGIFYAVHLEEIEALLAQYEGQPTPE